MAEEKAKKKKINKMTLEEIEEALKKVQEHMKNFNSKYAQHLLKRKKELTEAKS
jgi:tetrahydromethanopterin S-methyltransferase subunit G